MASAYIPDVLPVEGSEEGSADVVWSELGTEAVAYGKDLRAMVAVPVDGELLHVEAE